MSGNLAAKVKELREITGAGFSDCKKALENANGDMEKAMAEIRRLGLAKAAKKVTRKAGQGVIKILNNSNVVVMADVRCETDFVAKNEKFQHYVNQVIEAAIHTPGTQEDVTQQVREAVRDHLGDLTASVGENIQIARVVRWQCPQGKVYQYIHDGGQGMIGVIVEVVGVDDPKYGKELAMHICAANPRYIQVKDVPATELEEQKKLLGNDEKALQDYLKGICLLEQPWVLDEKMTVKNVKPEAKILRFLRWQVGEPVGEEA